MLNSIEDIDEYSNGYLLNTERENESMSSIRIGIKESIESYLSTDSNDSLEELSNNDRLNELISIYNIKNEYIKDLYLLKKYKIIIICDDSGSMNTNLNGTNLTRWNQLYSIVKIIFKISIIFNSNGIDIYFLNRQSYFNIKDINLIDEIFSKFPHGYTPLAPILENIFKSPLINCYHEKKTLLFIATDGQPTDNKGNINTDYVEYLLTKHRNCQRIYVMFLICTDDHSNLQYLSNWDKQMINLDVTNDYQTEKDLILSCRGKDFSFSMGDYICKILLGAIHPYFDGINEQKPLIHITQH